jgi:hemoglobin
MGVVSEPLPEPTTSRQLLAEEFFAAVGGEAMFWRLVRAFYAGVATDPELRAIYPEPELDGATERLALFLIQYWGGPSTYSERRGHPRLRMRHVPYVIDTAQHDRWLRHMRAALDEVALAPEFDRVIWDYLVRVADTLINAPG